MFRSVLWSHPGQLSLFASVSRRNEYILAMVTAMAREENGEFCVLSRPDSHENAGENARGDSREWDRCLTVDPMTLLEFG